MTNNDTDTVVISERIVFESIIAQATQCKTKAPEYAKCLRQFIKFYSLEDCEDVGVFFNASWKRFQRLKKLSALKFPMLSSLIRRHHCQQNSKEVVLHLLGLKQRQRGKVLLTWELG